MSRRRAPIVFFPTCENCGFLAFEATLCETCAAATNPLHAEIERRASNEAMNLVSVMKGAAR